MVNPNPSSVPKIGIRIKKKKKKSFTGLQGLNGNA
jgi:hypothetical protein